MIGDPVRPRQYISWGREPYRLSGIPEPTGFRHWQLEVRLETQRLCANNSEATAWIMEVETYPLDDDQLKHGCRHV